ncbi:MAG: RagB/SusD family nutrient uptake outer membrane protein [Chitinophagaceae bacterium]|nr:RagB/SusD family nutrient uptake outer membrane protein [Chitinophagaceae bacterium]
MRKILIAITAILMLAGCKKEFLDATPTDAVAEADVFTTVANGESVMNGIYRYLYSRFDNQNTPGQGGIMLMFDFMGEDVHQALASWYTPGNGCGGWLNQKNADYSYVAYPFRMYYRCIGNANAVIENVDKLVGTQADKNRLKGEALTMRAWAYFYLVQIYGKRYDATTTNSQLGVSMPLSSTQSKLPRSTVEEVYTQINKDLTDAVAAFGTASAPRNKSHLSLRAAYAIWARVALTQQKWALAAQYANQVITLGGFSLMSNVQYQEGFNNITNPEWIWGAFVQDDQGDTFGSYLAQISYNGNTSYIRGVPKRINSALYNLITATDVRKKMWEPSPNATNFPLPTTAFARTPYMSRKFSIRNLPTIGDVPYIRLAEMYLIIAEANARIPGNEVQARAALFTLAVNRDPSYTLSTNSGAALLNEILVQRRVEFWAEGHRWFDLKRMDMPVDRTVVPNYVPASAGGVMQVPAPSASNLWEFSIPTAEIQGNPNTVQNN